jgi:hypothetical protein
MTYKESNCSIKEAYGLPRLCRTPSLGMYDALHLLLTFENVFPIEIQVVETQQQCYRRHRRAISRFGQIDVDKQLFRVTLSAI